MLYRLGRHVEAAEVYASISTEEEQEAGGGAGGFSPVSVNLAAAYAAAGRGDEALEAIPVEDVSGVSFRSGATRSASVPRSPFAECSTDGRLFLFSKRLTRVSWMPEEAQARALF